MTDEELLNEAERTILKAKKGGDREAVNAMIQASIACSTLVIARNGVEKVEGQEIGDVVNEIADLQSPVDYLIKNGGKVKLKGFPDIEDGTEVDIKPVDA